MAHVKGKKFTAAEKYFSKKEKRYQDKIEQLKQYIKENNINKQAYEDRIVSLQYEIEQLKDWVERLLKYTELDKKDIKSACEKDKQMNKLFESFEILSRYL